MHKLNRFWLPALLLLPLGLFSGACSDDDDDKVTDPTPALGACCDEDGNCGVLTEDLCDESGGIAWHEGLTCEPNPCDQPGSDPDPDPVGHLSFTFDGTQYAAEACMAIFFGNVDETSVSQQGEDGEWVIELLFHGNTAGSFSGQSVTVNLNFVEFGRYRDHEFTIEVTSYGDVGGAITGTFSGTVVSAVDEEDIREITEGVFTAVRLPDVG